MTRAFVILCCLSSACDTSGTASPGDPGPDGPGQPDAPPTVLGACDDLPPVGTFENITPPFGPPPNGFGAGGTFAIAADPVHQGTVYAGTFGQGIWKSTNCGAHWDLIATGANHQDATSGMNWTFAVDPIEPDTIYTNSGYGANGLFKSTNGGVDWAKIWPPASQPELGAAFTYNFANVIAIDPRDHTHILLTFHEQCLAPHAATCIAETHDAGATWSLHDGRPEWNGNEGQVIFFLESSSAWLWGSQTNGFWRTSNAGGSWQEISGMTTSHLQSSQLVRTPSGAFVVAGADAIWRSPDGAATTWKPIANTGPILGGIAIDGSKLYASNCYFGDFCAVGTTRYFTSSDDGVTWTSMPGVPTTLTMGGTFAFDPGHGLLFSSNLSAGMWRVRVR